MLKYKCLILDHDDTVVKSTKEVHYPAFMEMLDLLRPEFTITLEEFIDYNSSIGFLSLCKDILELNDDEMVIEYEIWKKYTRNTIPVAYEGMKDLLLRFQDKGGLIAVSSLSESFEIKRDFEHNFGFLPDEVFGWDLGEEYRKPKTHCIEVLKRKYHFENQDLIMIDDAKPGYSMCETAGITFVGNCYYNSTLEIQQFMQEKADFCVNEVSDLYDILFE